MNDNSHSRHERADRASAPAPATYIARAASPLAWLVGALVGVLRPLALLLVFVLLVTPLAFLMRVIGKDPLRLRSDPKIATYWVDRKPPGPAPDSLKNQY
jgi:hypothetical protein